MLLILPIPKSQGSDNSEDSTNVATGGKQRDYYIRIELSQWEVVAYDLNLVEDLVLSGIPYSEALELSKFTRKLSFEKNSRIHLQVFSLDVQHGISIPQSDIQQVIERRDYSVYTFPVYIDFTSPNEDTSYELSCHVYCGLGHSDMKFKFVFGEGSKEYGEIVFLGFVAINLLIFLFISKKLIFNRLIPTISD